MLEAQGVSNFMDQGLPAVAALRHVGVGVAGAVVQEQIHGVVAAAIGHVGIARTAFGRLVIRPEVDVCLPCCIGLSERDVDDG